MMQQRQQSAMEYLMTYGWAILVLGVVLAALYSIGLLSPQTLVNNTCIFEAPFSCLSTSLSTSGQLNIDMAQDSEAPINITAIGCNLNGSITNMQAISPANTLQISQNISFTSTCYGYNNAVFSGGVGTIFNGYFIFNYTNLQTGLQHTVVGSLKDKLS